MSIEQGSKDMLEKIKKYVDEKKQDKLIIGNDISIKKNIISSNDIQFSYYIGKSTKVYIRFVSNDYIDDKDIVIYPFAGFENGLAPLDFTITRGKHDNYNALECVLNLKEIQNKLVFDQVSNCLDVMFRKVPRYQTIDLDCYESRYNK